MSDGRVVADRQPDHTHDGNVAKALARKAVGDMKVNIGKLTATPSSSQATVATKLDDQVLMALPKRATINRALQRRRQKLNGQANGGNPLLPIHVDLTFNIPDQFRDLVLYDTGAGDSRNVCDLFQRAGWSWSCIG